MLLSMKYVNIFMAKGLDERRELLGVVETSQDARKDKSHQSTELQSMTTHEGTRQNMEADS